jgi:uncharacterized protein YjbI with pentapeptide repeats
MQQLNNWCLQTSDGRWVGIDENPNLLYPMAAYPSQPATQDSVLGLWQLDTTVNGVGTIGLKWNQYAWVSARVGDFDGWLTLKAPNTSDPQAWITTPKDDETYQIVPTGDGYFALYSTQWNSYITYATEWVTNEGPLLSSGGPVTDITKALRFTWVASQCTRSPVFDFLEVAHNLSGFSLSGVDLTNVDLSGVNLSGCDFTGATWGSTYVLDLSGCNLTGATITNRAFSNIAVNAATTFTNANLSGSDFRNTRWGSAGPNLSSADLSHANLQGVSFSGYTLTGANMSGADLSGADFSNAELSGANLQSADLTNCNFSGAHMSGADLRGTTLGACAFNGADLSNASMQALDYSHGVTFAQTNLAGARLDSSNTAGGTDFRTANLAGASLANIDLLPTFLPCPIQRSGDPNAPTSLAGSTFTYTVLQDASGANDWSNLDLTGATIVDLPTTLADLNASHARLSNFSFEGITLAQANFSSATLDYATFSHSALAGVNFNQAVATAATFTHADLEQTTFIGAALGGVDEVPAADFSYAYLGNCDFTAANLFGVVFANATLIDSNLKASANLLETDFSNAYLLAADFTDAIIQGARFDGAFLVQSILDGADLSPSNLGSVQSSLTGACLQAASFQGTNLTDADLSNAAITDAAGSINQQYYDQHGNLTPIFAVDYGAMPFPDPSCFNDSTVCPNGLAYGAQAPGTTMATMMTGPDAPTSWTPRNSAGTTSS